MWVKLARPKWDRSCADCQKYVHDNETGERRSNRRTGLPLLNTTGSTDCCACEKIPSVVHDERGLRIDKVPANNAKLRPHAADLSPVLMLAWQHYRECRAVGQFPDDPIVRANAARFRQAEDEADRQRADDRETKLIELFTALTPRRR